VSATAVSSSERGARRLGLRGRLALSIAAIVVSAFAVTFLAVYRGTGSALRGRIDRDLRAEVDGFAGQAAGASETAEVVAAAQRYIAAQPFGPAARLLIVSVTGGPTVTNQPDLINGTLEHEGDSPTERRQELGDARSLRSAPLGFSSVELTDTGEVRLLSRRIETNGGAAVVRAGEPVAPVKSAQSEVSRTFLLVGALTLAAALLAAYLLAARTAGPLRRIASVAAAVDAGDLTPRIDVDSSAVEEVRTLAEAFDHMLDRLDDAFSRQRQFVSDASHELRTPLTAIRGQLEVLARHARPEPAEVRRVERLVMAELARIERLVADLLTLARLEETAGLRLERLSLQPYLEQLLEGESTAVTVGALPSGALHADPERLRQVLRNLISNAHTHAGPDGRVTLSGHAQGSRLVIQVDDDGPGIPPQERERVFDRFHRLEASRDRHSGGSGLGLAIARAIIELHGGRIWVEASPLGGARVAFELDGFETQLGSTRARA
jgi:two-component system OmpR family sensor kinase